MALLLLATVECQQEKTICLALNFGQKDTQRIAVKYALPNTMKQLTNKKNKQMEKFTITPQTASNIQIHEEFETFQMLSDGTWSYRKFNTDGQMLFIFNTSGPVTVLNIEIRSYDLDNHADHPSPTDEQREMIREAVRSIAETI